MAVESSPVRTANTSEARDDASPASPATTVLVSALSCTDHEVEDECRYQVAWAINPHMAVGSVDFRLALAQHDALKTALARAGAQVIRVPFVHGAYDSVFSKDTALLIERRGVKRALVACMRYPERQREQGARAEFYKRHNFEVICDPSGPSWEGGDVVMLPSGGGLFLGYGPRSQPEAAGWLERHAGVPVHPLELRDPYLYHLDMALAILPDGTALACEEALSDSALRELRSARGIREIIRVSRQDALAFGLNLVSIGNTVLTGGHVPRIDSILRAREFCVEVVSLDQFHLAGGSAGCLVAKLYPDPEARRRPAAPTLH